MLTVLLRLALARLALARLALARLASARMVLARLALVVACMLAPPAALAQEGDELPGLGADITKITVSGFSSGAYMAGQFQIAHSRMVVGAAIISGGPYGCADSSPAPFIPPPTALLMNLNRALNACMRHGALALSRPSAEELYRKARRRARRGAIDGLVHIRNDRVYLFSGGRDKTVSPKIVALAKAFYIRAGIDSPRLHFERRERVAHGFATLDHGGACSDTKPPFIVDCDFDLAGLLLEHLLGKLAPRTNELHGDFVVFNQRDFTSGLGFHGMGARGIAYIPRSCRQTKGCRVHVVFHGCRQFFGRLGDRFARETGYAQWAEANRLIILFPQTRASPVNPKGCWDWWGYTGRNFLTRSAPQIRAVHRMLKHFAGAQQR